MKKFYSSIVGAASIAFVSVSSAMATSGITIPTEISLSDWESLMGVILTALAGIWIGRKLIGFTNKS